MGREQNHNFVAAVASAGYLLVLLLLDDCHAQTVSRPVDKFSATTRGPVSARTVVCTTGGSQEVATVKETISFDAYFFSTFTLQCQGSNLSILPATAGDDKPEVCPAGSTLDSCSPIPLEKLEITAAVKAVDNAPKEKTIEWKIYPAGFPRAPQKWNTGCVLRRSAPTDTKHDTVKESVSEEPEGAVPQRGCLVTVLVRQAPPVVVNNKVQCSFGKDRTVTPVVSVTSSKPFVRIECGSGADFVPQSGGYCSDPRLDTCTPRPLQDIFPQYLDSWGEVEEDKRVLTIPAGQLPKRGETLYFGCVLRRQTVESEKAEDYYCVVPVFFKSAARFHWGGTTLKDSAMLWAALLPPLSFIVTPVT